MRRRRQPHDVELGVPRGPRLHQSVGQERTLLSPIRDRLAELAQHYGLRAGVRRLFDDLASFLDVFRAERLDDLFAQTIGRERGNGGRLFAQLTQHVPRIERRSDVGQLPQFV